MQGFTTTMDRTSSNPLFGERGAAPIPEEYQKKKPAAPRPPPAPPAVPPPSDDQAAHEEFERARLAAAKKREAAGRPLSFRYFLPRLPSSHKEHVDNGEQTDNGEPAEPKLKKPSYRSMRKLTPHPPSMPPPLDILATDYTEFDQLFAKATELRRRKLVKPPSKFGFEEVSEEMHREFDRIKNLAIVRRGLKATTPISRGLDRASSFFSLEPPRLEPTKGMDDGDPIKGAKPEKELRFRSARERCVHEIRHRHALERALMAGLAVCLLWLTSLAVARSIVNTAIYGPALKKVMNLTNFAVDVVGEERDSYAACASRLEGECNRTFTQQLQAEVDRTRVALTANRVKLDQIMYQRNNCSDKLGDVITVLDFLANNLSQSLEPRFTNVANLSVDATCKTVRKTLDDQIAAVAALKKAEEFQAAADEQVLSLQQQIRAREQYDRDYLTNSTKSLLGDGVNLADAVNDPQALFSNLSQSRDAMLACATESGQYGQGTCSQGGNIGYQIKRYRDTVLNDYTQQKQSIDNNVAYVKEQYSPIIKFYNNFRDAMRRFGSLKAALDGTANDNGGNGGGLAAFGFQDIDTDFGNLNMPTTTSFGNTMGSTAGMTGSATDNVNGLVGSDASAQGDMQGVTDGQKAAHTSWQEQYFSDYNPPPYDVDFHSTEWVKTSSQYLPDVNQDLAIVSRRVSTAQTDQFVPTIDSTESGRTARQIIEDSEVTPFELYTYDNINPLEMLSIWDTITTLALAMDYVYRVLRSIYIIRSYTSISAVMAPPADVRVGNVKKGVAQTVRLHPDQVIANLITNPAVNLVLALIFIALVSAAFMSVYLPFFEGYHDGCIIENTELILPNGTVAREQGDGYLQEGSMITNFARRISEQVAYGKGDSISANAIDTVNLQRELQCSKNEDLTFKMNKLQRQELEYDVDKMNDVNSTVQAFRYCINATAVDLYLGSANISKITNGSITSIAAALYTRTCDDPFPVLNETLFNCNAIRNCTLTCAGVNQAGVYKVTYDAGCTGEHYMHSSILGTAFSLLAFVLMNLSRWTFLRGLRRVLMDHFAIGEYSYLATTNEHGDVEYPAKVTDEGLPFKIVIRDELHQTIKKFKRSGLALCFLAILINLPWIIGLSEFSKALQFQLASQNDITAVSQ